MPLSVDGGSSERSKAFDVTGGIYHLSQEWTASGAGGWPGWHIMLTPRVSLSLVYEESLKKTALEKRLRGQSHLYIYKEKRGAANVISGAPPQRRKRLSFWKSLSLYNGIYAVCPLAKQGYKSETSPGVYQQSTDTIPRQSPIGRRGQRRKRHRGMLTYSTTVRPFRPRQSRENRPHSTKCETSRQFP